jgi:TonB family protein
MRTRLTTLAFAGGILLAASGLAALAAPVPQAPPVSRWAKFPSPLDYATMRPQAARHGGRAVVRCHVDEAGLLSACATLTETPAGSGYGQALASLAPQFQMKPELVKTEAPDGRVVIMDETFDIDRPPEWLHKPSANDLLIVWPKAAWAKHMGGRAVISCLINVQGALFDCVATSETPAGANFGAAAVALTPQFLMKPAQLKGQPVVSGVNIPIVFAMAGGGGEPGDLGRQTAPAAMAWAKAPSYADMAQAYPRKAREAHLAGHATVSCSFTRAGDLTDCVTIAEQPKGEGFGAAAHSLARKFKAPPGLDPKTLDRTGVQLPFSFDTALLTDEKPAIGKPQWAALPTAEETAAAFDAVTKAGVGGTVRVMLHCTVEAGGGVSDCAVAREEPAGQGVGQAALSLAPRFKITTWTMEGLPTVGGSVNIPLRYEGARVAAPASADAGHP